jgi:hypothetical protein
MTLFCRKLRIEFSSGHADSVQAALEDHVFNRVTAPSRTYGVVYSTDMQDDHENTCHECGDVGELIICDKPGCKFSFHLKCVGLNDVPEGDWFCKFCSGNPIDPNDGHHVYCVECGAPGNLIMCDAENCPRSYHCSCIGLSDDVSIIGKQLCQRVRFHEPLTPTPFLAQMIGFALAILQSIRQAHSFAFCRGNSNCDMSQLATPASKTNCRRWFEG